MLTPSPTVQKIIEELRKLRGLSKAQARGMPPGFYTSPEYLEFEKEKLFRKEWICVGHAGEIPKVGDYFTTELIDEQLLVIRGSDAVVRILSNVCRHRGNIIKRGAGNAARLICGYHAWVYGLDGLLLGAPLVEHVDRATCRLPQFPVELWYGYIFVNLNGQTSSLSASLEALEPFVQNYHPEERHFLYGKEDVWATNWKCLAENFMEGYHLSPAHAKTLHSITPTTRCEKLPNGLAFTGYRANFNPECSERGPYHRDLSAIERRSDVFYCIYPSFVVGFAPHFTLHMCLRPLTADSVGIRWGIVGVESDPNSTNVKSYIDLCHAFCAEDREILERVQQGLKSRYYDHGLLAGDNYEGTIWDMLQYMSRRLGSM